MEFPTGGGTRVSRIEEDYAKAVELVNGHLMTIREAADAWDLKRSTLGKYCIVGHAPSRITQGRFKPTFTNDQEKELVDFLIEMSEVCQGMTRKAFGVLAFKVAERLGLEHRFRNGTAGRYFVSKFLRRHQNVLSMRTATPLAQQRVDGFCPEAVKKFQDKLQKILNENPISPEYIFNMDETGIGVVPVQRQRLFAMKGAKNVPVIKAREKGANVTMICCMSAGGTLVKPMFLFGGGKDYSAEVEEGFPGSSTGFSSGGWATTKNFHDWVKFFYESVAPPDGQHVLLILDNASCHVSVEAIEFCIAHNIHVLSIPPHTSHKMQPMDVSFFRPLKSRYAEAVREWQLTHLGRPPKEKHIPAIMKLAFDWTWNPAIARNGFRKCGIYDPLLGGPNPNAFSEEDFKANRAYRKQKDAAIQLQAEADQVLDQQDTSRGDDDGNVDMEMTRACSMTRSDETPSASATSSSIPATSASVASRPISATSASVESSSISATSAFKASKAAPATSATLIFQASPATSTDLTSKVVPTTSASSASKAVPATSAPLVSKAVPAASAPLVSKAVPATSAPLVSKAVPAASASSVSRAVPATSASSVSRAVPATSAYLASKAVPATSAPLVSKAVPATSASSVSRAVPATSAYSVLRAVPATSASMASTATQVTSTFPASRATTTNFHQAASYVSATSALQSSSTVSVSGGSPLASATRKISTIPKTRLVEPAMPSRCLRSSVGSATAAATGAYRDMYPQAPPSPRRKQRKPRAKMEATEYTSLDVLQKIKDRRSKAKTSCGAEKVKQAKGKRKARGKK